MLIFSKSDITEERQEFTRIHAQELINILSSDFDIECIFPETAAMALMTHCPPGITAQEIFVLDFIPVGLDPLEEFIDTDEGFLLSFRLLALPDEILDLLGKIAIRFENRNAILVRDTYKMVLEPSHFLTLPARNGPVIYAQRLVRDHKVFAHAYYLAKSTAYGACTKRAVETEHILIRFAERHSISLKPVDKALDAGIFLPGFGNGLTPH